RYRLKSAQRLVDELVWLERTYGVRRFNLSHDLFTVNRQKVRAFCDAVAPLGYKWTCSARMDCVDAELLRAMADSGCSGIFYGVETGSRRMQAVVSKRLDLDLYHPTLAATLRPGNHATVSFITGYPEETVEDQDATLALIGETLARYSSALNVQLHVLTPEPGTALHARFADRLAYDGYVTDFNFPALSEEDAVLMRDDPATFVCHHYYDAGPPRRRTLAAIEAMRYIGMVHDGFARAVAREIASFPEFAVTLGKAIAGSDDPWRAFEAVLAAEVGAAHPLVDILRFAVAQADLRPESEPYVDFPAPDQVVRLARCAAVIDSIRDWPQLRERLTNGENLEDPPIPSGSRLLLASRDLKSRKAIGIDAVTAALATLLRQGTTERALAKQFERVALVNRLRVLCAFGAVVEA
ncbi:MAG: hypothetical protein JOZ01_09500, partial [Candidatus Eremiobacteraeota bacterium]|nr:hypothetical protein [Candidatus Eremiobacteraeota bacterium]